MVYAEEEEFSCPNCDGEKENINLGDHEELNLIICHFFLILHCMATIILLYGIQLNVCNFFIFQRQNLAKTMK